MITAALIIFIFTYVLLLAIPKYRAYIALASAAIFVIAGILPIDKVLSSVDWNVILMIAGTTNPLPRANRGFRLFSFISSIGDNFAFNYRFIYPWNY